MTNKGKLYLIPVFLDEDANTDSCIVPEVKAICSSLKHFIVENEKTARKFLKLAETSIPQNDFEFFVLEKNQSQFPKSWFEPLLKGYSMGIMSEAGVPCIADPGSEVVKKCHQLGINIVPLVGASSIMMALMASGMNGQQFVFHGYLPIDKQQRAQRLKQLEKSATQFNQTQIFIETPYRNNQLLEDIVKSCSPDTRLHISCNLTSNAALTLTQAISQWRETDYDFHKRPAVFIIGR